MDNIKLVSGKSNSNGNHERSDRSRQAPPAQSRAVRPVQPAPIRPQEGPVKKPQKAKMRNGTGGRKAIVVIAIVLAVVCAGFAGLGI
ncbi:MAG: hypothetical protein QMB62_07105 [Oscillospiraceae bacterium]